MAGMVFPERLPILALDGMEEVIYLKGYAPEGSRASEATRLKQVVALLGALIRRARSV
jgi:hypothetical protein